MKLRIATWNLERPRTGEQAKIDALIERIQEIDADIWIFTEAHESVSPGPDFKSVSTSTIPDPLTHTGGECRTAIWTCLPILEKIETHDPETAVLNSSCRELKLGLPNTDEVEAITALANATPGDFANCRRQARFRNFQSTGAFVEAVAEECRIKADRRTKKLGFAR